VKYSKIGPNDCHLSVYMVRIVIAFLDKQMQLLYKKLLKQL